MLVPTTEFVPVKRSPLVYGNDSMNLDIILTNLDCRGTESSLLDCQINNRAMRQCDHSEDAGVRCGGILYCTVVSRKSLLWIICLSPILLRLPVEF